MTEVEPSELAGLAADIVEPRLADVADEEEIAQGLDAIALLALAEQRGDGQVEMLTEQIEQRGLHGRDGVDHDAEIKSLLAAAAGVAVGEGCADVGEDVVHRADGLADHE